MLATHKIARSYHNAVDLYVALTEFAKGRFVAGGFPSHKIATKPNFILQDLGAGSGAGGYALYVGRLDEGKGIEVLLPAWQKVAGPNHELRILGDGLLAPLVERGGRARSADQLAGSPADGPGAGRDGRVGVHDHLVGLV